MCNPKSDKSCLCKSFHIRTIKQILYLNHVNHYALVLLALVSFLLFWALPLAMVMADIHGVQWDVEAWEGQAQGASAEKGYCEEKRLGFFLGERYNSLSNIFYFIWGFIIFFVGVIDWRYVVKLKKGTVDYFVMRTEILGNVDEEDPFKPAPQNGLMTMPVLSIIYGLGAMCLGVTSFMFHASLTVETQRLDITFTIFPIAVGAIYCVARFVLGFFRNVNQIHLLIVYGIAIVLIVLSGILVYVYKWELDSTTLLLTGICIFIVTDIAYWAIKRRFQSTILLVASIACLVIGYIMTIIDKAPFMCNPTGFIQAHSIWHLFTSLSILFLYFHIRTDSKEKRNFK